MFVFVMHHINLDGGSMPFVLQDIQVGTVMGGGRLVRQWWWWGLLGSVGGGGLVGLCV